jgi:hypothetical protein
LLKLGIEQSVSSVRNAECMYSTHGGVLSYLFLNVLFKGEETLKFSLPYAVPRLHRIYEPKPNPFQNYLIWCDGPFKNAHSSTKIQSSNPRVFEKRKKIIKNLSMITKPNLKVSMKGIYLFTNLYDA